MHRISAERSACVWYIVSYDWNSRESLSESAFQPPNRCHLCENGKAKVFQFTFLNLRIQHVQLIVSFKVKLFNYHRQPVLDHKNLLSKELQLEVFKVLNF